MVSDMSHVVKYYLTIEEYFTLPTKYSNILPCHSWSLSYGRQLKHGWNMNLSRKHRWYIFWWPNIIIIYKIQKSFDKRYFNRSNDMIVKTIILITHWKFNARFVDVSYNGLNNRRYHCRNVRRKWEKLTNTL